MARTKNPAPHAARSAADAATTPAPAPVTAPAGDSPAAAVPLAANSRAGGPFFLCPPVCHLVTL
jgi:hypothetical protein